MTVVAPNMTEAQEDGEAFFELLFQQVPTCNLLFGDPTSSNFEEFLNEV